MKLKYLLFVVILSTLITGCIASQQSGSEKSTQEEFSCDIIGAEPQLFYVLGNYLDDPKFVYWKMRLPTSSLNQQKYQLTSINENDPYLPNEVGSICDYGSEVGENQNYLYCGEIKFSVEEISSEGTILSKKKITLKSVFEVDKDLERDGETYLYYLESNAKLISEECTIADYN
jgi:hypothetical protein